jgi:hypothetical protein
LRTHHRNNKKRQPTQICEPIIITKKNRQPTVNQHTSSMLHDIIHEEPMSPSKRMRLVITMVKEEFDGPFGWGDLPLIMHREIIMIPTTTQTKQMIPESSATKLQTGVADKDEETVITMGWADFPCVADVKYALPYKHPFYGRATQTSHVPMIPVVEEESPAFKLQTAVADKDEEPVITMGWADFPCVADDMYSLPYKNPMIYSRTPPYYSMMPNAIESSSDDSGSSQASLESSPTQVQFSTVQVCEFDVEKPASNNISQRRVIEIQEYEDRRNCPVFFNLKISENK